MILQHLAEIATGKIERLAVYASPGAGKSTYSALFAAWWLANNPTAAGSIILASHTQNLADKQIDPRAIARDRARIHAGIQLDDRRTAAERWALQSGAEVRAVGAGTAITGFRASLVLLDDPVKGIEQAMSASEKEKLHSWFRADLSTRLVPSGRVVAIQTSWALDDLFGRLLDEEPDRWTLLSLPAYAEANDPLGREVDEPLWNDDPVYNYPAYIADNKRTLPPRMFVSLFQQRPVAAEGNLIKGEWLKITARRPTRTRATSTSASTWRRARVAATISAIVTIAVDANSDDHIVDVWKNRRPSTRRSTRCSTVAATITRNFSAPRPVACTTPLGRF